MPEPIVSAPPKHHGPMVAWAKMADRTPDHALSYIDFIRHSFFEKAREQDAIQAELLAALKYLVDATEQTAQWHDDMIRDGEQTLYDAFLNAKAAIAKAEGR